jgi:hypothetical protein
MTLRFEVDQAEAFRQGVNVEKSTNHLDVDPSKLSQEERNLIADRLDGIDVCELNERGEKQYYQKHVRNPITNWLEEEAMPSRIKAKLPTFEGLMEAIRENEKRVLNRKDVKPAKGA